MLPTRVLRHHTRAASDATPAPKKANLGELAVQEAMTGFALAVAPTAGVFLFEDHKLARASFLLPESCRKVTTRPLLLFLEQQGLVASAADVHARALHAGRAFSKLRFPPAWPRSSTAPARRSRPTTWCAERPGRSR